MIGMKLKRALATSLVVAGLGLVMTPREAHAVLRITATEGSTVILDVSDNDGPIGADTDPNSGIIRLAPTPINIGSFRVESSTTVSNANFPVTDEGIPQDGPGVPSLLGSRSQSVRNITGATATTTVVVEDINFGPSGLIPALFAVNTGAGGTFQNLLGNAVGSSILIEFFADPANTQRATGNAGALSTPTGTLIDSFFFAVTEDPGPGNSTAYAFPGDSPIIDAGLDGLFGLSMRFTLTLTPGTSLTSRSNSEIAAAVVPEPSTVVLSLAGLPLLGFSVWKRRKARA